MRQRRGFNQYRPGVLLELEYTITIVSREPENLVKELLAMSDPDRWAKLDDLPAGSMVMVLHDRKSHTTTGVFITQILTSRGVFWTKDL